MEVKLSFYLYQILAIGVIWGGMTYFLDQIEGPAIYIYYAITSWLLFLIVMAIKKLFKGKANKDNK